MKKLVALVLALAFAPGCHSVRTTRSEATAPAGRHPAGEPALASLIDIDEPPRPPEAPIGLTASDGSGLRLRSLRARAVVDDPLAFTELHLAFENPEDRRREGTFKIALPPGASVARFAMKIDDRWQEGEVVERKHARVAYEDFLHKRQDPALLEQSSANEFSARVFPIPPRGIKELIVSYSQEIGGHDSYVLPLRGLPKLGILDVSVSVGSSSVPALVMKLEDASPDADAVLDPTLLPRGPGLRSGNLVLARVRPVVDAQPDPIAGAVVLFDTSASRALGFAEQTRTLARVIGEIVERAGAKTPLAVACFDQSVEPVFEGEAGGFGRTEIARIWTRRALGASNLEQALGWARDEASKVRAKRVLLMSDGVATAGATEGDKLGQAARSLKGGGVERLDVIRVGGIRDDAGLARLATAGLARDGVVVDGALATESIVHRLSESTRSGIAVKVDGATWSWPRTLDGVQPGDDRLVYADVPAGHPIRISVAGAAPMTPDLPAATRPLLERSWAQAKIADLVDRTVESTRAETVSEIVELSVSHRVLSPYTGMLVLETEQDYARFGIDRRALTDVLTFDGSRLMLSKHARQTVAESSPLPEDMTPAERERDPNAPAAPWGRDDAPTADSSSATGNMWGAGVGDSFGAGGLGLSGAGEGGGGQGEGIGLGSMGTIGHGAGIGQGQGFGNGRGRLGGAHQASTPSLRQAAVEVSGRLPTEVIQRIVRQNFGRFRLCYENGLRSNPNLQGRVAVRFAIGTDGSVATAVDGGSDLPDAAVVACVARAFLNLSFPSPEGGKVTVVYPIVFSPDGSTAASVEGPPEKPAPSSPYTGRLRTVMDALAAGRAADGLELATAWHKEDAGDVMALVGLGEAFERTGDATSAARAYGSIVDLFPSRADMRRFAGERLERLGVSLGLDVALDTYAKAEAERPDHPSSHRLLAFVLLQKHEYAKAFAAAEDGLRQSYPGGRFRGVQRVLAEDLGLIGAAWIKAEPARRESVTSRIREAGGTIEDAPSLRFVLTWETDANDVDLHVFDAKGGHAFYSEPRLASGGELYADVTTGYGPECFTIRLSKDQRSGPYTLQANYYARGPMGYGMGKLEVIDHDGHGGITFEERPFVVMADHAFVDLGTVAR
jgi:hypothetical protein